MKNYFAITIALLFFLNSFGQDAKEILKQAYSKCQSVQNGYYEMTKYMKYMSHNDTSISAFNCHFQKLKDDSLYSSAFHYKAFWKDVYSGDVLYTGNDFVRTNAKDSTATIMSKSIWAKEIKSQAHNNTFYSLLTNRKSYPLPDDSDLIDNQHIFKLLGEVLINGAMCYHIQMNIIPENDSTEMLKALRNEYNFWLKKTDFIPIQYSQAFDFFMNNDTMYQYEKYVLNKYEINNLNDSNSLTLNSIPTYYRTKTYVPYRSPELLKKDSLAPDWALISLTDEKISLNSLRGKLVLIDFFYKSCYPCMQALPALQALNEKYKANGLQVIGIDPYDKKEDGMETFLSKRGVTYTVLLGGKETAKDYHVSGYPTMYLIDKKGNIIFIQEGYGKDVENTLNEIIKKNL